MVQILKKIKASFPWLWEAVEFVNGLLVSLFFCRRLSKAIDRSLNVEYQYKYRKLNKEDAEDLVQFISEQPKGFDTYFKPHPFDLKTFRRVLSNGTYVLVGSFDGDKLIGYCFIRFFINKSAFRGKIVDKRYQGRGIAKHMGQIMTNIAADSGFRVYATISKDNVASLKSANYGASVNVIKELPDNYLYVEIRRSQYDS